LHLLLLVFFLRCHRPGFESQFSFGLVVWGWWVLSHLSSPLLSSPLLFRFNSFWGCLGVCACYQSVMEFFLLVILSGARAVHLSVPCSVQSTLRYPPPAADKPVGVRRSPLGPEGLLLFYTLIHCSTKKMCSKNLMSH
jgi:hypothetical protein